MIFAGQIILKKRKSPKLTEICGVCGDRASSHFQYGSQNQICFACRGFFRRIARNKIIPQQKHCNRTSTNMEIGKCQVDLKTRKKCTYCRYIKCCDLGMKTELVMSKEETKDYMDKAKMAKKTGIASKLLPETKYKSRIRAIQQEKNNQTENQRILDDLTDLTQSQQSTKPEIPHEFPICNQDQCSTSFNKELSIDNQETEETLQILQDLICEDMFNI